MTTHVVLFTRDLRVHDRPALHAAVAAADTVVPLFVLDDAILRSPFAAPNRCQFLLDSVTDLRASLRAAGGDLVVRRGNVVDQVAEVVDHTGAQRVHVTGDVSAYARSRERALEQNLRARSVVVEVHPGHLLVEPGDVAPAGGDHYRVFTPYWRRWRQAPWRTPVAAPTAVHLPRTDPGVLPSASELVPGEPSPATQRGGEGRGRQRLAEWLDGPIADYAATRDDLADETGTSRLSAHLHLGTVSVAEVVDRLDQRRRGHEPFLQQLCWCEFDHQLLAANPGLPTEDYRPRGDQWRDDDEAFAAWCEGQTGYPVVDAGMRQLRHEGYMHNRARMVTASFLTKHLYMDWRRGAAHFAHWLVDADLANNWGQWQWVAGTGTDSRPDRVSTPSPSPDGTTPAATTSVPELAEVADAHVHAPWTRPDGPVRGCPPPIVDHGEARRRFLHARGAG